MTNKEIIKEFYTSFSEGNAQKMIACYHEAIVFKDPVFGTLKGEKAKKMWEMLLSNTEASPKVMFSNIESTNNITTANWQATYLYGPKKRKVTNKVHAEFVFKDGKIIKHTDNFNTWTWSKQALGFTGLLLGWSGFLRNKIQEQAQQKLFNFINKQENIYVQKPS